MQNAYIRSNTTPSTPAELDMKQNVKGIYQYYSLELKKQMQLNQAKREKEKKEQSMQCSGLLFGSESSKHVRCSNSVIHKKSDIFKPIKEDKAYERSTVDKSYHEFQNTNQKAMDQYIQMKRKSNMSMKQEIEEKQKRTVQIRTQELTKSKLEMHNLLKDNCETRAQMEKAKKETTLKYREELKKQIQEKHTTNNRERKEYGQWGTVFGKQNANGNEYQCISCNTSLHYS